MIEKINIAVLSVIYMYKYPIFLRNFTSRYRKKSPSTDNAGTCSAGKIIVHISSWS